MTKKKKSKQPPAAMLKRFAETNSHATDCKCKVCEEWRNWHRREAK
jgi:hypothetical protein